MRNCFTKFGETAVTDGINKELPNKLINFIFNTVILDIDYPKDYLQVIEIVKENNKTILKIKQEDVNDIIKAHETKRTLENGVVPENILNRKIYLIEDDYIDYKVQTLLFANEY